jgi:hypothetical protein
VRIYNSHTSASLVHMVCRHIYSVRRAVYFHRKLVNRTQVVGHEYTNTMGSIMRRSKKKNSSTQVPSKSNPSVKNERVNLTGFPNSTKTNDLPLVGPAPSPTHTYIHGFDQKSRSPALNSKYPGGTPRSPSKRSDSS